MAPIDPRVTGQAEVSGVAYLTLVLSNWDNPQRLRHIKETRDERIGRKEDG